MHGIMQVVPEGHPNPWDAAVRRHLFGRHFEIHHLGSVDALNDNLRERGASRVLAVELVFIKLAP